MKEKPVIYVIITPLIFIYKLIKSRPLITITLAYIILLLVLDQKGSFNSPPSSNDLSFYVGKMKQQIRGRVSIPPQEKNGKISFIFEVLSSDNTRTLGKTIVNYKPKDKPGVNIEPGDVLLINGDIKTPPSSTNPGVFNYSKYLERKGIYATVTASSIEKIGFEPPPFYKSIAYSLRKNIIKNIEANFPPLEASLLVPMLVGSDEKLSCEVRNQFINAGVMHVLVVSGLNVAYVAIIFLTIFRLFGLRQRYAAFLTIPFIILYTLLTGANPPVLRASVMAIFVIVSLGLARESGIYQSLALAALTILIFDPQSLFTASFMLSFGATLGIVYLYPILFKPFTNSFFLVKWFMGLFLVSISAQVFVDPLLALYFNKISVIGIISNVVIVPLSGLLTSFGIVFFLVNSFFGFLTPVVKLITALNYFTVKLLYSLVVYFSNVHFAVTRVPTPSILFIACYYTFILAVFHIKRYRALAFILIPVIVLPFGKGYLDNYHMEKQLTVTFLDVGYGDAIHIKFPDGKNWLLDTGGSFNPYFDVGQRIVCPYLWSQGVKRLEKVIITDFTVPRTGGLEAIMDNFEVDEIVTSGALYKDDDFIKIMEHLRDHKIYLRKVSAGNSFIQDKSKVELLSPETLSRYRQSNSLVLQLEYFGNKILFTSDMPYRVQKQLAGSGKNLTSTILELPKHGKIGIGEEFMYAVNPKAIIVSKGKNPLYDPDEFKDKKLYSTTDNGAVRVQFYENGTYKIDSFKK